MHNDRLQGILFDQPMVLDLTVSPRRLALRRKIDVVRAISPSWHFDIRRMNHSRKGKQRYESDLSDLQARLKVRDL